MLVLTPDELKDLTGKVQARAQMRELTHMGVPFRLTTEGKVKVLRSDLTGESREEPRLEKVHAKARRVLPSGAGESQRSVRREKVVPFRQD